MAKNVLTDFNCRICGKGYNSIIAFTKHIQSEHNITKSDYTVKHLLNGVTPTCVCGCGKTVKVNNYKVNECFKGHSGGGNWQTKYDKDSDQYKSAVSKVSKSVKEYMVDNPPIFSEGTKKKHSEYMKELLSDPEEKERRRAKMQETKRVQSENGTLSDRHFTKNKTKEEVNSIYSKIGSKASNTKILRFGSGELVPWNRGKDKFTDERIEKRAGENHYKFNPSKDEPYTVKFYDKEYRRILRENQDGRCLNCNSDDKTLCLHHVDEDKSNDSFDNLIFVCRSCHSKIHNNKETKRLFDTKVTSFKQNIISNKI